MSLTLEDHVKNAHEIKCAIELLRSVSERCGALNKSDPINKTMHKMLGRDFLRLKSLLDYDYHKVINKDQFSELGHIYYGTK